jgi:hypothetical protein
LTIRSIEKTDALRELAEAKNPLSFRGAEGDEDLFLP